MSLSLMIFFMYTSPMTRFESSLLTRARARVRERESKSERVSEREREKRGGVGTHTFSSSTQFDPENRVI